MINSKKLVLFVFTAIGYYKEALPIVKYFRENGYDVLVLIGFLSNEGYEATRYLKESDYKVIVAPEGVAYGDKLQSIASCGKQVERVSKTSNAKPSEIKKIVKFIVKIINLNFIIRISSFFTYIKQMKKRKSYISDFFSVHKPDCVFLGSYHSVGQIDNCITKICKKNKITLSCIPNSVYLGEKTLLVSRQNHLLHGMANSLIKSDYDFLNKVMTFFFKSWTRKLPDGSRVFYWDPIIMFAAYVLRLEMNRLWMKPSLDFEIVFLFSEYSKSLLLLDGYEENKLIVSGQPLLDEVIESLNDEKHIADMFKSLMIEPGDDFLLLNVEPSLEHSYCSSELHWENFNTLLRELSNLNEKIILSLHPLCNKEDYFFAEKEYGVKISTKYRIHDLYPFCSISISFPCSTNVLADRFKKTLVIYDFFGLIGRDSDSTFLNKLPNSLVGTTAKETKKHVEYALLSKKNISYSTKQELSCKVIFDKINQMIH